MLHYYVVAWPVTTILTNKVNGARYKANSDFIELAYPKNGGNKK